MTLLPFQMFWKRCDVRRQVLEVPFLWALSTRENSTIVQFGKLKRKIYAKRYPLRLVNSDGSCFHIMVNRPQLIFHVPFDKSKLSPQELNRYLLERKSKLTKKLETRQETVLDNDIQFEHSDYSQFLK